MSNPDSFFEEVTEAVRRDRLFALIRRYGWIAGAVVVLLVGGAAYNEWSKAQSRAAAQARGDAILAALRAPDSAGRKAALSAISGDETSGERSIVALLTAAEAADAEDRAAAVAALDRVVDDAGLTAVYRDLATLKRVMLTTDETTPADRISALTPLTVAGGPYRVLAEEQIALAEIEAGRTDDALKRLRALSEDTEATAGLRRRVAQLIVALGGSAEPA